MPEYKSFEQIQEDIDNDKNPVVNDVWNAAIEAAAKSIGKGMTEIDLSELAYEIRKLRK